MVFCERFLKNGCMVSFGFKNQLEFTLYILRVIRRVLVGQRRLYVRLDFRVDVWDRQEQAVCIFVFFFVGFTYFISGFVCMQRVQCFWRILGRVFRSIVGGLRFVEVFVWGVEDVCVFSYFIVQLEFWDDGRAEEFVFFGGEVFGGMVEFIIR